MNIQSLSPTSLASSVWSAVSRSLTSLGGNVINPLTGVPGAFPPSTLATFYKPAAFHYANVTASATAQAGGTFVFSLFDGVVRIPILTLAAGQSGYVNVSLNHNQSLDGQNNDPVNTVSICVSGYDLT